MESARASSSFYACSNQRAGMSHKKGTNVHARTMQARCWENQKSSRIKAAQAETEVAGAQQAECASIQYSLCHWNKPTFL
jgi:hypothetical protein